MDAQEGVGAAAIASYHGQTVYAVGSIAGALVAYRTGEGGTTWRPCRPAGPVPGQLGDRRVHASVRADGALIIQIGDQAGEDPVMLQSTPTAGRP